MLPHSSVSRSHAIIRFDGSNFLLEDLLSSNGTFVNGRKIKTHQLSVDDKIQLGPYELVISHSPYTEEMLTDTLLYTPYRLADVVGQVRKGTLAELFQSIEFNEKTGTLFVADGLEDGFIVFCKGRPTAASFSEIKNEDAIIELLKLTCGHFMLLDRVDPMESTMNTTFTNILLNYSRIEDEHLREESSRTLAVELDF